MIIKRRAKIIEYIREKESASIEELCKVFNVSKNTIRRDIDGLAGQGILKKVYGGVVYIGANAVIPISIRQEESQEEKDRIGRAAAKLVQDNDIIAIDAGSTTVNMVRYLKDKNNITVITNSINVANEAIPLKNIDVILVGGTLLRETYSLVGFDNNNILTKLNVKKFFMAATGVSIDKGLTNSSFAEADIKKAMIKCANEVVLMVDHSKFDMVSLVTFYDLKDVDCVITDENVREEYKRYFEDNNIKLIIAEQE